jgi:hypothetical protein
MTVVSNLFYILGSYARLNIKHPLALWMGFTEKIRD